MLVEGRCDNRSMNYKSKNNGFSLAETLLAVAALAVGMMFIAGVFPVGIYFSTVATERTIAAIAADEAFAKVKFCGVDFGQLSGNELKDFNDVRAFPAGDIDPNEFTYPSAGTDISSKQYYWSALCRLVGNRNVQVTVFVSRKIGAGLNYYDTDSDGTVDWSGESDRPMLVKVKVGGGGRPNELEIANTKPPNDERPFINDGYTIVDNETGQLYRVLERYPGEDDRIILLDRDWDSPSEPEAVWVIPPPIDGGRYPCIAIYQKVIRF
jgi:hypothetical protein